jgi:quercetin dioxygenase-like cupin family protein/DNA-binding XRE family transcriptional regulator
LEIDISLENNYNFVCCSLRNAEIAMKRNSVDNKTLIESSEFKTVSVGQRLRELRIEKGYSIKSLALESGLAVNTISLIENHKSSPSVSTLEQLAKALQIPLGLFFEPIEDEQHLICTHTGNRKAMVLDGVRLENCGLNFHPSKIQSLIVTLPSGKGNGTKPINHSGFEFVYCLSGALNYTVEEHEYVINVGDSLLFEAKSPHYWKNCGKIPAVYLLVMVPEDIDEMPTAVHFQLNQYQQNQQDG